MSFRSLEAAFRRPQSIWLQSPGPPQDHFPLDSLFGPLPAQILGFLWSCFRRSGFPLLSQTQCVLLFTISCFFFTFHDGRPSGCCVPLHSVFYFRWVLSHICTNTNSSVFSFPCPFFLLLIKSYIRRGRKLPWPVEYIHLFLC